MLCRCDADPAALAKYVVALVKKDKPIAELKDVCVDQLEVFLSNSMCIFHLKISRFWMKSVTK